VLTIHPGFQTNQLESIALEHIDALIIRAYGSGNFPVKGEYSWIPFLHRCKDMDLITVITSQANHDAVNLKNYSAGRTALDFGVLSSGDMTLEASVTKMMWLISAHQANDESNLQIAQGFQENLRGERS
jgi:L-asparaginase